MISPDFSTLLETDVVRVLGPEMVKVSKSSRSWKKPTKKSVSTCFLVYCTISTNLTNVVIGGTNVDLKKTTVVVIWGCKIVE